MSKAHSFTPPRGYKPYSIQQYEKLLRVVFGETLDRFKQAGLTLPQLAKLAAEEIFLNGPGELSEADLTELRYQLWALRHHGRFFFEGWEDA